MLARGGTGDRKLVSEQPSMQKSSDCDGVDVAEMDRRCWERAGGIALRIDEMEQFIIKDVACRPDVTGQRVNCNCRMDLFNFGTHRTTIWCRCGDRAGRYVYVNNLASRRPFPSLVRVILDEELY